MSASLSNGILRITHLWFRQNLPILPHRFVVNHVNRTDQDFILTEMTSHESRHGPVIESAR